jgi:dihydroorotate dehydrogenase electron transfer subunit
MGMDRSPIEDDTESMKSKIMIELNAKVRFNKKVARETFLMGLESSEIATAARPGHFVMIRVREGTDPLLRRPFSICGTERDRLFHILYRVVGPGTSIMSEVRKGDSLSVLGPLGNGFELPRPEETPILVAGGIGIAPIIFLAGVIGRDDALFMAGFRTADEIVDFEACGLSGFAVSIATDDGTVGHLGFVTDLLERRLGKTKKNDPSVFVCGPAPMLKKVAAIIQDRGIPGQVSLEAYMACGVGACQGCAVKASSIEKHVYLSVCEQGPVFRAASLDWSSMA